MTTKQPRVGVPDAIDIGDQDIGQRLNIPFTIRNLGEEPLVLNEFDSSCGCVGILSREKGALGEKERLVIDPGQDAELIAVINARGKKAGKIIREQIRFKTNDPSRPDVSIELGLRLRNGICAAPSAINIVGVLPGTVLQKTIHLQDVGRDYLVRTVKASNSEIIQVKAVSAINLEARIKKESLSPGKPSFAIDLEIRVPHGKSSFSESIDIEIDEDKKTNVLTVPVCATIGQKIGFSPAQIMLPRQSQNGLIYTSKSLCVSVDSAPMNLIVLELPTGIFVSIPKDSENGQLTITVRCDPKVIDWSGTKAIVFAVRQGTEEHKVRLKVTYLPSN